MPFVIQWADNCTGTEDISKIITPAGTLLIYSQSGVISRTDWEMDDSPVHSYRDNFQQQLAQYWLNLEMPIHIKLLKQGTPFRNQVWAELCKIPFGETTTYSTLAGKIGSAARAVGNACRDNPFPLLIPCHRVVSKSGMGGYNGQTDGDFMTIKHKLLDFEATYRQ